MGYFDKWLHSQKMKKAERVNELQVITTNNQQQVAKLRYDLQTQELEFANKAADLKHKITMYQADAELRQVQVAKELDVLEQSKAKFRIQLDEMRQKIDLERERFDNEQQRSNKALENDFTIRMSELRLKRQEREQAHGIEHSRLDMQRELQQLEFLKYEDAKAEKMLDKLKAEANKAADQKHTERMTELKLAAKQFEWELASIRLLSADMQSVAYERMKTKMQERMNGILGNEYKGGLYGNY